MKKFLLLAFIAAAFISCQKETEQDQGGSAASTLSLTINVNKALSSRAIEGGHDGLNGAEVSPKIFAVTVLSYNDAGTILSTTDLNRDQIDQAIYGNYRKPDGTPGTQTSAGAGTTVGLPQGTTRVDVVVNRAPLAKYSTETNINYVNYRDNKDGNGDGYSFGGDNFDRVVLATTAYGQGIVLAGNEDTSASTPTYRLNFSVTPHLARMEVYGGINVAAEEVWIDGYGNKWRTMKAVDFENYPENVADATGHYPKGAIKGTGADGNGFDEATVYISEYYWYRALGSVAEPVTRTIDNTFATEDEVNDPLTQNAGWVPQPYYVQTSTQVKWLPNRFYAVDVESVFVNNIKVRSTTNKPYAHPWPDSQASTGWPNWYNAFHIGGWHTQGISGTNTFLCMGNMWDRIATSQKTMDVSFTAIGEISSMKILTGKAEPITDVSQYYSTDRNLGIKEGRAAGYAIYPQAKSASTPATDAEVLRAEMPHVILKLKAYKDAASYAAGTYINSKEFITIKLFSDTAAGGTGNYITSIKGGYIYRLNLNDLLYQFVGNVPVPEGKPTDGKDPKDPIDPDPEMPTSQLIMNVQVMPWILQNIYPSI